MPEPGWVDVGSAEELARRPLKQVVVGKMRIALSFRDGEFGAISGNCNHVGGPLGDGTHDGNGYVTCPWHGWKFHWRTGFGEPGFEDDRVPAHDVKVEGGRVLVAEKARTTRNRLPHEPNLLARKPERAPGPVRVVGISTTMMNNDLPRFSTSEELLDAALGHCDSSLGCERRLIRLRDLNFRACEGYYSKSARACTWPCSITQMDPSDQLDQVYEAFVHWADVLVIATPIRWGSASSLYYKMVERMNCIQNHLTIAGRLAQLLAPLHHRHVPLHVLGAPAARVRDVGELRELAAHLGEEPQQLPGDALHVVLTAGDDERGNLVSYQDAVRDGNLVLHAVQPLGHTEVERTGGSPTDRCGDEHNIGP
ncbi:MAG: Rieske 2Fe-2S domain-containing protein, partial [Candidatus Binatia bacterium]